MCVPTLVCFACPWAHCARPVLLEKVPAVGVVVNWGFSLQAWLCVMADIPRVEQGSGAVSQPGHACCAAGRGAEGSGAGARL